MALKTHNPYPAESVGNLMSLKVLVTKPDDELQDVFNAVAEHSWTDIQYAYVIDAYKHLIGVVDLAGFPKIAANTRIKTLMKAPLATLHPLDDQEKAVVAALKNDLSAVPVIDHDGVFLGAVTAKKLIDIMHEEHLEDALLTSGMRGKGSHILSLVTSRYKTVISSRLPWLIFGAIVGLGLGVISSFFKKTLEESVALAYFVPVVAYIADSVGTQSEAITIRALAILKINYLSYLLRELFIGLIIGGILGIIGGIGASLIVMSPRIGLIVGISLFTASAIACILASAIPILFKLAGKDPALGSGPLATAVQDVLSVLIYFLCAIALM